MTAMKKKARKTQKKVVKKAPKKILRKKAPKKITEKKAPQKILEPAQIAPTPVVRPRGKVVIFGAGLVARPMVRYLLEHDLQVTVADAVVAKAEALVQGHPLGKAAPVDAEDAQAVRHLVGQADLAVSLLPAQLHPVVARACLAQGKHMVTASYVSPAMRGLDAEARAKGLLLLNEVGLDPGIDHMSAMKVVHAEQRQGWTLTSFTSWCGGLPAPEISRTDPFRYKFSWAPRGVLTAAGNQAEYLEDGQLVTIPPERLFSRPAQIEIPGVGVFEGYPNRDSVSYLDTYGLSRGQVRTILRGTLRYPGHCELYTQIVKLGLLVQEPVRELAGLTYRKLLEELLGGPPEATIPSRLGQPTPRALEALRFIGMLDDKPVEIPRGAPIDVMAHRMAAALAYGEGERDMLLMRHDLVFERGGQRKRVTAIMEDYGIPHGDSSMARAVSLPAAIGVRMALEGKIRLRGVQIPVVPELYLPILAELARLGIALEETTRPL
ncbi:MAG TPA: saccharopine dehydrogenase C-terminal domain-containing protein [Myxococcota bacterium]|nr:saccharopine dehydrogenase C-terminal domain-containing protein [Myxococcota bacterium]HRY93383.1 saccharopine dehydrogenase C-terminal domain-containing protein [Myxococcota bacterium]